MSRNYTVAMASPKKRRVQGGRVTPKGTQPHNPNPIETVRAVSDQPSAPWVSWVMFALFAIGMIVIFLNYTQVLGDTNNAYTLLGLGFILGGIITATRLR